MRNRKGINSLCKHLTVHTQGIVHRDIKPSNVMVVHDSSTLTLMDFGLAKLPDAGEVFDEDEVLGTLQFMAPEQIQASPDLDGRADIYALAASVYQLLTGHLPFEKVQPLEMIMAHLYEPLTDPREFRSDLPNSVSLALIKAMSKTPESRYTSCAEFVADLYGHELKAT
ncbi:MAG: serine/threonine protein kinase [Chloroflexi bacterium]|nr:serine/threonine protein kinase [Chloroflexota bacterium]